MKICMGCMNQIEEHIGVCPYCGYNAAIVKQESYYLKPESILGGKYIVGRVLNYSGHVVSYIGFDAEQNRKVVIKEYLPSDFSTRAEGEKGVTIYSGDAMEKFEQGLINFLNEANRIQRLNKIEAIAKVYDCLSENDTGYVISEYIEGHTLKEILDTGKRYSPEEARRFISKILRGLCLVHPLDIIHCDISPETIMIAQSGGIKLLDFGATRYVTTENSKSLAIILKQGYAPEEQYRSQGIRGPWTDVYALAAVMYRMITGIVPQESVERMLNDELKAPSQMGVAIPENLENALMNALNIYQLERTQSAEMFLRELNSPTVNRIQVKKRKRETGKIPLWAKGLVAGLLCLVMAGGIIFFQLTKEDEKHEIANLPSRFEDLSSYTYDKAQTYIDNLNRENKWSITLKPDKYMHRYTNGEENRGKICAQSVMAYTDLEGDDLKKYGLKMENGKISGVVKVGLYRSDKLFYQEVGNAFTLAEQLGTTIEDKKRFNKNDTKGKKAEYHDYYSIKKIQLKSGAVISGDELRDNKAKYKEISVGDIKKTIYYADDFFYWKTLKNQVGKTLKQFGKQKLYKLDGKQNQPTPSGRKLSLSKSNLVDNSYFTFENSYQMGQIVEQTKKGKVDSRELGREKEPLFKVITYKFSYKGKTGKTMEKEIRKKLGKDNISIQFPQGGKENIVKGVNVKQNGKDVDYFSKDDLGNSQVIITTKEPDSVKTPLSSIGPKTTKKPNSDSHSVELKN